MNIWFDTHVDTKWVLKSDVYSIMLEVSMQEVKAGKVAYNIGGQFITLQALNDIMCQEADY